MRADRSGSRDGEAKRCAIAGFALDGYMAAVRLDQDLNDGKAQTNTSAVGARRLPEAVEEVRNKLGRDATARVRNAEAHRAMVRLRGNGDRATRRRELYGVVDEVGEDLE
jgi:hypothetical protein